MLTRFNCRQWWYTCFTLALALIKRLIHDCDYYILIVGGRYATVNPEGISYKQMECQQWLLCKATES